MKELPIDDFYTKGTVREDGRVMRPYYLLQVKKPSESKYPFDYLKLLATVPAEDAARPLSESACPTGEDTAEMGRRARGPARRSPTSATRHRRTGVAG